jgi:hypothetical protein
MGNGPCGICGLDWRDDKHRERTSVLDGRHAYVDPLIMNGREGVLK